MKMMGTKEDMFMDYHEYYEKAKEKGNEYAKKIFMHADKAMFMKMAESNPEMAKKWLGKLEAMCWDNYLSDEECMEISNTMINSDGTKGFHWNYATFKEHLGKHGLNEEDEPKYNCYALLTTMNMVYSDHAKSISEDMGFMNIVEVPADKMFLSCYRKAIEKLCDKDANFRIREYFKKRLHKENNQY